MTGVEIAAVAAAAIGAGATAYSVNQQGRQQDRAVRAQQEAQAQQERLAQEQMRQQTELEERRARQMKEQEDRLNSRTQNQRSADQNAALQAARQRNRGGNASTLLTGPQGVSTGNLPLGGPQQFLG